MYLIVFLHDISTRLPAVLLMTPRITSQDTVVAADHRGGWTQIFGGKASEFQTAKVILKVTQGHRQWCHSIGDIRFPISVLYYLYVYYTPLFPKM